ncbi:hypothetical protein FKW77_008803 [Venturia effusa]|uniref:Uncharacterized protein n=1 Tax=Venturia effusa TaxID=50376 RepID=A0A517LEK2_9PEZI|nr:hypothetical protein FKW77_008803 [Venturia effusa]
MRVKTVILACMFVVVLRRRAREKKRARVLEWLLNVEEQSELELQFNSMNN